jgi:hypothetical protein
MRKKLMRMLRACISSDEYAQDVLKGPFQMSYMLTGHALVSDAYSQRTHQFLIRTPCFRNTTDKYSLASKKQISEMEEKPSTSSLKFCPEACCIKGWGREE